MTSRLRLSSSLPQKQLDTTTVDWKRRSTRDATGMQELLLQKPHEPCKDTSCQNVPCTHEQDGVGVLMFSHNDKDRVQTVERCGLCSPSGCFGHFVLDLNADIFSDMMRLWEERRREANGNLDALLLMGPIRE
jgi:hypothetical protein